MCRANLCCDEVIPEKIQIQWTKWEKNLKQLEKIAVERCYKPTTFGALVEYSLHHFADACEYGYGQVSYLRLVDDNGRILCSLMIGKACVAPLKVMTIPRMELVAATLSVKMSILLKKKLESIKKYSGLIGRLYWDTLGMNRKGSKYLWQAELNSPKVIKMNPIGIISVQNRTQQIMHQERLIFVMIKLKGGILDHSFFGNQRQHGLTTK